VPVRRSSNELIRGAERQAAVAGYTVVLADTEESPEVESVHVERLARMVDGVVVGRLGFPSGPSPRSPAGARSCWSTAPCAGSRTWSSTRRAGCRTRASTSRRWGTAGSRTSLAREPPGPTAAAGGPCRPRAGVWGWTVTRLGPFAPTVRGGAAGADAVVNTGASAVVAFNDLFAIGTMRRLLARGVRVPGNVSVLGCDDIFGLDFWHPALTTLAAPIQDPGRAAVDLLLSRLTGSDELLRPCVFSTHLVVRESTGPPG
jgi:LacI family repressor for deo operon, udp, cdd, tsx, nupC, and nupG